MTGIDEAAEQKHKEGIGIIKLTQEASSVYEEQKVEEKRFVITKLFQKIQLTGVKVKKKSLN